MKETIVELNDNTRIVILDEVLTVETLEYSECIEDTTKEPLSVFTREQLTRAKEQLEALLNNN
jgi:hypothetical protein